MLTFAEVCEHLRLAPKTVRNLIVSGELEAFKTSDKASSPYRITEQALAEYIERRKAAQARAAS